MKAKLFLLLFLFGSFRLLAAPPLEEGKAIFSTRCAGCHNVNKVVTGPALAGVDERRSIDWIIRFVHSPQSVIKSGDRDAVALFEKFNRIPMPDHTDLTADNIRSIVEYIRSESKAGTKEQAPFSRPEKLRPAYNPLSIHNTGFFIAFFAVVAVLIAALLLAVQVKGMERKRFES